MSLFTLPEPSTQSEGPRQREFLSSWSRGLAVLGQGALRLVATLASLLGLEMAVFLLCLHTVFPPHVCVTVSSCEDISPIGLGPTPITSL